MEKINSWLATQFSVYKDDGVDLFIEKKKDFFIQRTCLNRLLCHLYRVDFSIL